MSGQIGITIEQKTRPSLSVKKLDCPSTTIERKTRPSITISVKDGELSTCRQDSFIKGTIELKGPTTSTLQIEEDTPSILLGEIVVGASGQSNTASNLFDSPGAIGLFKQKVAADLQFKSLRGKNGITITDSAGGNEVCIDPSGVIDEFRPNYKIDANCLASDSVGDCVYITGDQVSGLYQVTKVDIEDKSNVPCVGVIISKSSDTVCCVQLNGIVQNVYSGMTPNKVQFISSTGAITETCPEPAAVPGCVWIQSVGQALSSNVLLLRPDPIPTKKLFRP